MSFLEKEVRKQKLEEQLKRLQIANDARIAKEAQEAEAAIRDEEEQKKKKKVLPPRARSEKFVHHLYKPLRIENIAPYTTYADPESVQKAWDFPQSFNAPYFPMYDPIALMAGETADQVHKRDCARTMSFYHNKSQPRKNYNSIYRIRRIKDNGTPSYQKSR